VARKHVIVTGRVQGVGFRYSACREAIRRGVGGYARNLSDGTVEIELEGDDSEVAEMLDWLAVGPLGSKVAQLKVDDMVDLGETEFTVRR
jgi:acylphosphatase